MKTLAAGGKSSLVIVPVPVAVAMVAPPCAFDSVTVKVSSASVTVSPAIGTRIVAVSAPAANDTVPLSVAVARSAAVAVPVRLIV